MRTLLRVAPALLLASAACDSTAPAPVPTSIVLDRSELSLDDGDTAWITASVLDQRGEPMDSLSASTPMIWTSSASLVALVDDGVVRAVGPGDAEITARAGEAEATATVTVLPVAVGIRPAVGLWHLGEVAAPLEDSIGVRVFDRSRRPVAGVAVHFEVTQGGGSVSATPVLSGADGYAWVAWVLGPEAGHQAMEVTAEEVAGRIEFLAQAMPGTPAEVRPYSGNGQAGTPGAALALPVKVRVGDAQGNPVEGMTVSWAVVSGGGAVTPSSSVTDPGGVAAATWQLGPDGEQVVSATVGTLAPALFTASTEGPGAAPAISSIIPERLQPGLTAVITGGDFGSEAGAMRVTIADVEADVLAVAPTSVEIRVPDRHLLPCGALTDVDVVVSVDGRSGATDHPLEVAMPRTLGIGEAVSLRTSSDISCNALPVEGEYLISVASTLSSIGTMVPVHVRGIAGTPSPGIAPAAAPIPHAGGGASRSALEQLGDPDHTRVLESSRRVLESRPPPRRSGARPQLSLSFGELPQVGDTLSFRVPDIHTSTTCSSYFTVGARVVHVGDRAIALEDVAAPLAGTMDARIRAAAVEYETAMHPLLVETFGDPLAVDDMTDGNGRIYMLFTERVNQAAVRGFVWGGDFIERADCAASNRAEVFYAVVPTVASGGYGPETPENWSWTIRSVIAHEVKHLASYAQRLAAYFDGSAMALEDVWLEESTARVAEEIWARTVFGYGQHTNTGYAESLYCEVRPTFAECAGLPFVMVNHFAGLADWFGSGGARTPLGRLTMNDNSFYGSGWSLVRWAADHSGRSEAGFFRALTAGHEPGGGPVLSGTENLAARTGRDFADLVEGWAVAMAIDDQPGVQPADPLHSFPSWNTRDVFAGLSADFPDTWPSAFPAVVRDVPLDGTTRSINALTGGSAAYWSVSGAGAVVEMRGSASLGLAPYVRVTIIRTR